MERHTDKEEAVKEGIRIAKAIIEEIRPLIAGVQVSPPFGRIETALSVIN